MAIHLKCSVYPCPQPNMSARYWNILKAGPSAQFQHIEIRSNECNFSATYLSAYQKSGRSWMPGAGMEFYVPIRLDHCWIIAALGPAQQRPIQDGCGGTVPVPEPRQPRMKEGEEREDKGQFLSLSSPFYIIRGHSGKWKANVVSAKWNKKEAAIKR